MHRYIANYPSTPLLHFDIHGKMDRDGMIEYGLMPLEVYSSETEYQNYVKPINNFFESKMNDLFKGETIKSLKDGHKPIYTSSDCWLHGFWGGETATKKHTLTE